MWQIKIYDLEFIDPLLRTILKQVEDYWGLGTITSLYRIGDKGVHGCLPLRGVDEECRHSVLGKLKALYINTKWVYDPNRPTKPCARWHDSGQGPHIHYQVHPNTIRREI